MEDPTAFITARLDEDEAAARELAGWPHWHHTPAVTAHGPIILIAAGEDDELEVASIERDLPEVGAHIARHDPARALREVAAKRAVLAWYADSVDAAALFKEKLGTGTHMATAAESYLNVMRGYAAVWSDHPDYKQEWAV
jgi:hypothetical protein